MWGVTPADPQQRWSCYKCSSSRGGKGGPAIEPKRGRSSTQAQVGINNLIIHFSCGSDKPLFRTSSPEHVFLCVALQTSVETTLDPQQEQSWDQMRCLYRGPSRVRRPTTDLHTCRPTAATHVLSLCPPVGHPVGAVALSQQRPVGTGDQRPIRSLPAQASSSSSV